MTESRKEDLQRLYIAVGAKVSLGVPMVVAWFEFLEEMLREQIDFSALPQPLREKDREMLSVWLRMTPEQRTAWAAEPRQREIEASWRENLGGEGGAP